jgi:hypothetical protein
MGKLLSKPESNLMSASVDELLARLTPEQRTQYERIRALREKIGRVNFNVAAEVRNIRQHG